MTQTKTKTKTKTAKKTVDPMAAINALPTTSAKIRALNAQGKSRSEIAKILDKRYQHVRNVLVTPLKKVS